MKIEVVAQYCVRKMEYVVSSARIQTNTVLQNSEKEQNMVKRKLESLAIYVVADLEGLPFATLRGLPLHCAAFAIRVDAVRVG